ncbi:O-antigen ligase family protein [Peribacillus frigoritolerans]|nr:O-antigen ligase family protein [Peribacillus frigoritolerans]
MKLVKKLQKKVSFSVIWFSAGLILSTATQLRIPGSPIGPGEIILLLWMMMTFTIQFKYRGIFITSLSRKLVPFWFFMFLCLFIGTMVSIYLGVLVPGFGRTFLAYLFSSLLFIVLSFEKNWKTQVLMIAKITVSVTVSVLLFLLIFNPRYSTIGPIDSWNGSIRFLGWSKNPNQVAMNVTIFLYMSLYLSSIAKTSLRKAWYISLSAACVWIGIETKSDAMSVALSSGFVILFISFWIRKAADTQIGYWSGAWLKVLLPALLCFTAVIFSPLIYQGLKQDIAAISEEGDQGEHRFILWENGIKAIESSPLFGLGPGAYSGEDAPFQGMEAHNTFIDMGMNVGLVGICLFLGFLCWIGYLLIIKKEFILFTGLVTVIFYTLFHFTLRHPMFWFYLFFMISICMDQAKSMLSGINSSIYNSKKK